MGGTFDSPASSSSNASGATRGGSYGDGTRGPGPAPSPGPSPGHAATRSGAYGDGTRGGAADASTSDGGARRSAWPDWSFGAPYRPPGASGAASDGGGQRPSAGALTGPGAFTGAGHDRNAAAPSAPSRPMAGDGPTVGQARGGGAGAKPAPGPARGPARGRSGGGGKATGRITGHDAGDVARARKIRDEAAAERRATDAAASGRAPAAAPAGPRPGASPNPSASAAAAKAPSVAAKPDPTKRSLSDEDVADLQRTAEAMKRTTDISGFQDILDGAVAIDPNAAAREIGVIRDLIAGSGLEGQLDAQLHRAMMKHVATGAPSAEQGGLLPAPAGEDSTLTGGAGAAKPPGGQGDLLPAPAGEGSVHRSETGEDALFKENLAERGDLIPGPADEALPLGSEAGEDALFSKVAAEPPAPDAALAAAPDGAVQSPGDLDGWTVRDPHSDARYAVDGDGALLRDINGERIAVDLKPGDPSPQPLDVETASQSVDMVKELRSTERFSPQQAQEAMAKADRIFGEGSAMAEAAKAYVMERSSALGENPKTAQAALERLNQLARDPKTFAGMRENRTAYETIAAGDRAAAKSARYEIERTRRAGMETAVSAYKRLHGATGGQMKRGLARTAPERRVAFEQTVEALAAQQTALAEQEAALPGVPHPDLDPGLASELGQDAAQVLDGYDKVKSVALDVGFTVAAALLPITAPAAALRAGATKEGAKRIARSLGLAADGADAVMAAQQAADEGVRVELNKLGLDPSDPEALSQLPPEAIERIRTRTAIAAAASVGSNKTASALVDRATRNAGLSELEKAAAEEGLAKTLYEGFDETLNDPLRIRIP